MAMIGDGLAARLERYRLLFPVAEYADGTGRSSGRVGQGVELHDHRLYTPGDDPRRIDWRVFARHRHLVVRLFREEVDVPVVLALDVSKSMDTGSPTKMEFASSLAGALAFCAFHGGARVSLVQFVDGMVDSGEWLRGRSSMKAVRARLAGSTRSGLTDLRESLGDIGSRYPGPAMLIVISDLLGEGLEEGLSICARRGLRVVLVHVLSRQDLGPELRPGLVEVVDRESRVSKQVCVTPEILTAMRKGAASWVAGRKDAVLSRGGRYILAESETRLEDFLFGKLREQNVLQYRG